MPQGTLAIRLARVFRFGKIVKNYAEYDFGAVAQLGARLNGIQEVRGSIPLSSTNFIRRIASSYSCEYTPG